MAVLAIVNSDRPQYYVLTQYSFDSHTDAKAFAKELNAACGLKARQVDRIIIDSYLSRLRRGRTPMDTTGYSDIDTEIAKAGRAMKRARREKMPGAVSACKERLRIVNEDLKSRRNQLRTMAKKSAVRVTRQGRWGIDLGDLTPCWSIDLREKTPPANIRPKPET
jgi:hypothetical protein